MGVLRGLLYAPLLYTSLVFVGISQLSREVVYYFNFRKEIWVMKNLRALFYSAGAVLLSCAILYIASILHH